MLDAALDYAERGWPVLPLRWIDGTDCSCGDAMCSSPGKHPLTQAGVKDASTDHSVIEGWWSRWPTANIGIATGKRAGVWVLDVDGPMGSASLTKLEQEMGALPETLTVQTSRGRHLYFAWVPGRTIRNKQNLRPGIDVRGQGGYVVAPPSTHHSGRKYEWL